MLHSLVDVASERNSSPPDHVKEQMATALAMNQGDVHKKQIGTKLHKCAKREAGRSRRHFE